MIYNEIDGLKYVMEKKEISKTAGQFPTYSSQRTKSYSQIYFDIEQMMNEEIHCLVVPGAASAGDGLLNDHGAGHVAMVQERAHVLLGERADDLNGYEIFFLLLSIHFHDVGNMSGRDAHEERIGEIFDLLGERTPLDNIEKRLITTIAMSHGGKIDGDKDTIAHVEEITYIQGVPIRASLLASILRYADEIADDKNRASLLAVKANVVPDKNRAFHEYSLALEPPVINGDTLILQYFIPKKYVNEKVSKNSTKVYLYDEILSRIQKNLCELEYCRKYSQGFIRVNCISACITVLSDNGRKELYRDSFKIRLSGYPDVSIYDPDKWYKKSIIRAVDGNALVKIINEEE